MRIVILTALLQIGGTSNALKIVNCEESPEVPVCIPHVVMYPAKEHCLSSLEVLQEPPRERALREYFKWAPPPKYAQCTDPRYVSVGLRDGSRQCLLVDRATGETKRVGCLAPWPGEK